MVPSLCGVIPVSPSCESLLEDFVDLKLGMVQFCAIKMSTKYYDMDLNSKRKINCVPEIEIMSIVGGQ